LISFSVASYNYCWYTFAMLEFPVKEASDVVGIYTSEKLAIKT